MPGRATVELSLMVMMEELGSDFPSTVANKVSLTVTPYFCLEPFHGSWFHEREHKSC